MSERNEQTERDAELDQSDMLCSCAELWSITCTRCSATGVNNVAWAKVEGMKAELDRLREALKSEQDSHGNTCEYFQNEIHRKMAAHGKSLEELIQVRALLFQLLEAVEAFGKRPIPPSLELAESFKLLAEETMQIVAQAGYSPERSSLAKFWTKEQSNG